MTDQPATDARCNSLHDRLTVALANAADRARLCEVIAGDLGVVETGALSALLRSEDLWQASDGFARERSEDRRALRSRLDAVAARNMHECDTARHQLEHLVGWRRTIVEGADWATNLEESLPQHLGAVQAVRDALDERRAEQRARQHALDRVLEQRMAAATAIEEADRELSELAGSGMDESGLRRQLEGAGQALRDAEAAHASALAALEVLQIEASGLDIRRETTEAAASVEAPVPAATVEAVRTALAELQAVSIDNEVDPDATALAEAWQDLHLDLEQVGGPGQGESALDLDAARRRLAAATTALHALDLDASASTITPAQRAALDAAHAEVLAAEEQVMGRRRVGSAIRKRLDDAHAAERALLDQHGFGGYLDVILSGGRSVPTDPRREAAEREHFDATVALDALERTTQASPDLRHLQSERARLLQMTADLLLVDPGDQVAELLRSHRPGPASLRAPLADALAAAGVRPVGQSLETAAIAFLDDHPSPDDGESSVTVPANEPRIELAAIEARLAAVEGELLAAEAEVARTDETLQRARRDVDIFEGELTVRAGEDVQRMKRFAAAEQLRAQIDAVAGTLRRAETNAREELEQAGQAVAAAESAFEHAASEISELARRARKLAEELPIDKRPEGDPLRTLLELAERLREHADVLQPEIDKAALAVDDASVQLEEALAACRVASAEGDGVHADDLTAGLLSLLDGGGPSPLVLDEPFVGVDGAVRTDLLEIVRHASQDRQIVLLTEDAEVLGWAIELPVQEATALPAEALLSRIERSRVPVLNPASPEAEETVPAAFPPALVPVAPTPDVVATDVDITTPTTIDTDQEATPSVRRWAGQR